MKAWGGLSRTEHSTLKFLRKQETTLSAKYDKMKTTIENRHLQAEADLDATVGSELSGVRSRIAELEAKIDKQGAAA